MHLPVPYITLLSTHMHIDTANKSTALGTGCCCRVCRQPRYIWLCSACHCNLYYCIAAIISIAGTTTTTTRSPARCLPSLFKVVSLNSHTCANIAHDQSGCVNLTMPCHTVVVTNMCVWHCRGYISTDAWRPAHGSSSSHLKRIHRG